MKKKCDDFVTDEQKEKLIPIKLALEFFLVLVLLTPDKMELA